MADANITAAPSNPAPLSINQKPAWFDQILTNDALQNNVEASGGKYVKPIKPPAVRMEKSLSQVGASVANKAKAGQFMPFDAKQNLMAGAKDARVMPRIAANAQILGKEVGSREGLLAGSAKAPSRITLAPQLLEHVAPMAEAAGSVLGATAALLINPETTSASDTIESNNQLSNKQRLVEQGMTPDQADRLSELKRFSTPDGVENYADKMTDDEVSTVAQNFKKLVTAGVDENTAHEMAQEHGLRPLDGREFDEMVNYARQAEAPQILSDEKPKRVKKVAKSEPPRLPMKDWQGNDILADNEPHGTKGLLKPSEDQLKQHEADLAAHEAEIKMLSDKAQKKRDLIAKLKSSASNKPVKIAGEEDHPILEGDFVP